MKKQAAAKKLNTFTIHGYAEDGSPKKFVLSMMVESGGDLRLFAEAPQYLVDSAEVRSHLPVTVDGVRVYGRDPDSIKQKIESMFTEYRRLNMEAKREVVIVIHLETRIPGRGREQGDFTFVRHDTIIALSFDRYFKVNGKFYEYRPDAYSMHGCGQVKGREIPYTDEAWATINAIQENMVKGVDRLSKFLKSKDLPALLAGGLTMLEKQS